MGKVYYCDYCCRSFKDEIRCRKNHLNSQQHIKARNNHYKQFKDLKTTVEEEKAKGYCKRVLRNQHCAFGDDCTFSHYTPHEIEYLGSQVGEFEILNKHIKLPNVDDWLATRTTKLLSKTISKMNEDLNMPHLNDIFTQSWHKVSADTSPISLQPINLEQIEKMKFSEWG